MIYIEENKESHDFAGKVIFLQDNSKVFVKGSKFSEFYFQNFYHIIRLSEREKMHLTITNYEWRTTF